MWYNFSKIGCGSMKKKKRNIKLIVLLVVIVLIGLGGFLAYDKFTNKDEKRDNIDEIQKVEDEDYKDYLDKLKREREEEIILKSNDDYEDGYEIRLTSEGEVIANVKAISDDEEDLDNKIVDTDVLKFFVIEVGQGDVGDNRELVYLKEDGSLYSISLGKLLINCEIKINDYKSLKWIVDVYDRVTIPASLYEPAGYSAYAKDIKGEEIDITKLIKENRY